MSSKPDHFETDGEHDGYTEEESSWLPRTPSATMLNLGNYFDKAFSPSAREDALLSGLTLLDTVETFFDARLDLWERQLKKQREKIQTRATLLAKERRDKFKTSAEEYDKEMQKFKLKVRSLYVYGRRVVDVSGNNQAFLTCVLLHRCLRGSTVSPRHGSRRGSYARARKSSSSLLYASFHFYFGWPTNVLTVPTRSRYI